LLFNCNNDNKDDCLSISLVQKLDNFKYELADSLSVNIKQLSLVNKLIEESTKRENILINLIEFDPDEIQSLKKCLCSQKTPFSDSNEIESVEYNLIKRNIVHSNKRILMDEPSEYLRLYWLYNSIDKEFVSFYINALDENTFVLNGDTLTDFSQISKRIIKKRSQLTQKQKSRSVISIKADKDKIDMDVIDKIENELREVDALRINYSTN